MKNDEISSTERLLDLIRDKRGKIPSPPDASPSQPPIVPQKTSFKGVFAFRKSVTVGVDIGATDLKLVAISQYSEKKQEFLKCSKIPLGPLVSRGRPDFSRFLKSSLKRFLSVDDRAEFWCAISSTDVETHYLRIPKVPKKQVANAVYWTHKKEVSFDEKTQIFDFEILGDVIEDGARKTEVMSYTAPKEDVARLQQLFSKSGYPLKGISIVPFALQNLFRTGWIETDERTVCSLFIGRDWTRIAVFSQGNLILSRGVKAGMISMVEAVRENIPEIAASRPADAMEPTDAGTVDAFDGGLADQMDQAQEIFDHFIKGAQPLADSSPGIALDEEAVFEMILPALERVVRQVDRTIEHYFLNFGNERVGKIYISGQVSIQPRMVDYIKEQLGLPIETIDPFSKVLPTSKNTSIPELTTEREEYVSAVGMALSNNTLTPNFIFTHINKAKSASVRLVNRSIISVFLIFLAISAGVSFWQTKLLARKDLQSRQLEMQLDKYSPMVNQDLILKAVVQVNAKMQTLKRFSQKYESLTVIKEISDMTPPNIRLLSISADFGEMPGKTRDDKKKILLLDGIVLKGQVPYEAALAGFIVKLKKSPIFGESSINQRSFGYIEDQEVLRFTAQLELV
ncbi:MAG: pilus assembly protein PilM [Deltaproteobacteria bacterium]|nr:pilus assembly protein PilM [Deltaproteobacteria bacterium]